METAIAAAVRKDFAEGRRLGLTGRPSSFINCHYMSGAVKHNTLREIVEQRLATQDGSGLFWFRGDGKGGWSLVQDCGLPSRGLSTVHSITLADVDHDGFPEIIALSGGDNGAITMWKRQ
jgi:hypothetical protein